MNSIFAQIWEKKVSFFVTFFVVFTAMYAVLYALDWLPEAPAVSSTELPIASPAPIATTAVQDAATVSSGYDATQAPLSGNPTEVAVLFEPDAMYIPRLDKTITVLNPSSRTVADLDQALLSGVVRHPDSALLNQEGNVFILGHSSYLPNVLNKNFQAFNGIQDLEWGDTIEVASGDTTIVYRVDKVYRAKASNLTVPIAGDTKKLTLATCNSFGSVDDRYIVEATQVDLLVK